MLKTLVLSSFAVFAVFSFAGDWAQPAQGQSTAEERSPVVRLGERLFQDERFSTPKGDLPASCGNCHLVDEDPQGLRAFTDFFNRSWVSYRPADPRRLGLRNSPTLLDVGDMPRLHHDGEFGSLEELVRGTIAGRTMGWLPGEEAEAISRARSVLLADKNGAGAESYREQFKRAFGVDLEKASAEETIDLVAKAVAAYCRTLRTRKDSPYDKFIEANALERGPAEGEQGAAFAARLLDQVRALEARGALKLGAGFDREALAGMKIFFGAGNCAACHAPPQFTDHTFRNIGISQSEYDAIHGDGAFSKLAIPNAAEARRPSARLRENPSRAKPGEADLGFWNFVDLKSSPLRREGESDDRFLERMIATFKTPTLRNLQYSQPYFHNGSMVTLEEALGEIMRLSEMARKGRVRAADEELPRIRITAADIPPLVAFLDSLNEDLSRLAYNRR